MQLNSTDLELFDQLRKHSLRLFGEPGGTWTPLGFKDVPWRRRAKPTQSAAFFNHGRSLRSFLSRPKCQHNSCALLVGTLYTSGERIQMLLAQAYRMILGQYGMVKNTLIVMGVLTIVNATAEQSLDWKLPQ